jgi:hypothetical protein
MNRYRAGKHYLNLREERGKDRGKDKGKAEWERGSPKALSHSLFPLSSLILPSVFPGVH